MELSSAGLPEVQAIQVTVDSAVMGVADEPTIVVQWDGRSTPPLSLQDLCESGDAGRLWGWLNKALVVLMNYNSLCKINAIALYMSLYLIDSCGHLASTGSLTIACNISCLI